MNDVGDAACEDDLIVVSGPVGGDENDFVAGVEEDLEGVVEGVFGAAGDNDLVEFAGEVVFSLGFSHDGFAQGGKASTGAVLGFAFVEGLDGGLADGLWSIEIGFASGE